MTQGDLTICCGYPNNDDIKTTISSLMEKIIEDEDIPPGEGIIHQPEGVDLVPANIELSSMELQLVTMMNREKVLDTYLQEVKKNYDYIIIDCMPSLGMITINAFAAADKGRAYKMKLEAIKRLLGRPSKENSAPVVQNFEGKTSREILAENSEDILCEVIMNKNVFENTGKPFFNVV